MPFWDEPFTAIKKEYPVIFSDQYHIDILNANFMLHPDWFNLVAESNLFVDILSDLAPAIAGKIGIAASANINPKREYPSMFEPVHCSSPDIAGKKIANPIASIWSAAIMIDPLRQLEAASSIMKVIEIVLKEKIVHTPDMGDRSNTGECGDALVDVLKDLLK